MFKEEYEKRIKENYNKRFNKYKRFNREKFNKFKDLFGTFNFGIIQDFYTFSYICLENNIKLKDFIEYVIIIKSIIKETNDVTQEIEEEFIKKCNDDVENGILKCDKCGGILNVTKINIPKGKKNINGWKTHFYCKNEKCDYEKFSLKGMEEFEEFKKTLETDFFINPDPDMNKLFGININDMKKLKENKVNGR